ncbi:glycine betaine ABC transporter substrate-binding protein [Salibacterium aidingense]|uniref:glycine betaine ABC transporter substrate-binding protein n=1 Tax=Salibacterium aidingense TaxID=384933 RepID=UPI00040DD6FB|nr:glycine betaine ABC transporter substrate-binding protein [Salibacterium aidingense]
MKINVTSGITAMLTGALLLSACGGGENPENGEEDDENSGENAQEENNEIESSGGSDTIKIGYNNWAENVASSNMWKILLEEEGYKVELVNLEKAALFSGVADGELDIGMEVWIPHTDKSYVDKYGEDFTIQEPWYENTQLGLTVPAYMEEVNSIDDLNNHTEELDGNIVGIEPGASLMELTEDVIGHYELDYELQPSSEQAMMTELDQAYQNEEPIVTTLWSPHWAFSEYDLKYLEDPDNVYGEADDIVYITKEGFEDENKEVVTWMNNWQFDDDSLGSLMATINEMDDPEAGAEAWIEENRDLVNEWIQ